MSGKKGKALAIELMDDLLNPDGVADAANARKAEKQKDTDPADADGADFDFSYSVISEAPPLTPMPTPDAAADDPKLELSHTSPLEGDPNMTVVSSPEDGEGIGVPGRARPTVIDQTERLGETVPMQRPKTRATDSPENRVRASVGRFAALRSGGPVSATEAALAQSENLRIAQNRLLEFEQEIERLRLHNEELAAAGETLRRRTDELLAGNQKRENDYQNAIATFNHEKEILVGSKEALQSDLAAARQKHEELELRISTNIQKIRVRERELENRLELVKMESAALIRSKDELILDLKRQIDQLNMELGNYRNKNQELNRMTSDKQEMLRRTVKALRLALSMLEGEEESTQKPAVASRKVK